MVVAFALLPIHSLFGVHTVYDSGSLFAPEVLDVSEDDLIQKFINVSPVIADG